ncbi:MAG: hypothetical protein WCW87_00525 [Candidatus Paceibacterota bacterium]
MDETEQILKQSLERLPKDIKQAIVSLNTKEILQGISKKHALHLDQIDQLETDTMLVMVGISHPEDFVKDVRDDLLMSTGQAEAIAADVNDQIFKTIRQSLIKMHDDEETAYQEELKKQQAEDQESQIEVMEENPTVSTTPIKEIKEEDFEKMSKDDLLKEIENPSTITSKTDTNVQKQTMFMESKDKKQEMVIVDKKPISSAVVANSVAVPVKPVQDLNIPEIEAPVSKPLLSIHEAKLNDIVVSQKEEKIIKEPQKMVMKTEIKKDSNVTDPYKEPLS